MNSTTQYSDRECTSKPGENKLNDGSDTTVSHDKENDSSSHSNEEKKGSSFAEKRNAYDSKKMDLFYYDIFK